MDAQPKLHIDPRLMQILELVLNLSVGFHNEHTANEYLDVAQFNRTAILLHHLLTDVIQRDNQPLDWAKMLKDLFGDSPVTGDSVQ